MLLAIDIGNTNIKWGVFDGDNAVAYWRISTALSRTADEYAMVLYDLLKQQGVDFCDIHAAVMSSVVPQLNYTVAHMCKDYIGIEPMVVSAALKTGLTFGYEQPEQLGADRIVGAAAAFRFYGGPLVEVDFGSATTFNLVTADGLFAGGAIALGIKTAADALASSAAKLPRIELATPKSAIGKNTVECMQSGVVFGFAGLVNGMVRRFKQQKGFENARVIATGGLSRLICDAEPGLFDVVDRELALKGLKYLYDVNR